jgi:hypothetical protein
MSRHAEDTPGLKPNTVSAVSPAHAHVHELHHSNAALMTVLAAHRCPPMAKLDAHCENPPGRCESGSVLREAALFRAAVV